MNPAKFAKESPVKMIRIVRSPWLLLAVLFGIVALQPASAQKAAEESDEYFKSAKIVKLDIQLGQKEMDSLRREQRKYVKATLVEDGKVVGRDVGVHLKGAAGSFRGIDDKAGLTLNMDKFVDGQRFHGMDKFHLANSVQDPSYITELLCGEMFRAAGVPASRIHHAFVSINGKSRGFYYLKEGYDNYFLKRHFGNDDGNLYDGGFLRDLDQDLQLISGKDDVKDRADLKSLVAAAREPDHKKRFEKMEKLLDLDKFISYLALQVICWDWDGYPINRNNYRVYHDPKRDKIVFIPSGMDQMFADPRGTAFPHFQGFVARALIETPQGKERYVARMGELLKTVCNPDTIKKRLDELETRVQPALASVDVNAGRDYKNQVNRLREAIPLRVKTLEEQIKQMKKK